MAMTRIQADRPRRTQTTNIGTQMILKTGGFRNWLYWSGSTQTEEVSFKSTCSKATFQFYIRLRVDGTK